MSILVVTPMQAELDALARACGARGFHARASSLGRLPVLQLPDLGLTLARGGTGKAQFAVQAQHLIDTGPGWDIVVCAGAAGALVDDLSIGDVVVATATIEHDYANRFSDRPLPRFDGAPGAIAGLRRAASLARLDVCFGVIASGDEDIVAGERRRALRESTGALAVAWEGAGGARACAFSGVPFVEMRGVTDAADQNAPAHFEANLDAAMSNVTSLLIAWLQAGQGHVYAQSRPAPDAALRGNSQMAPFRFSIPLEVRFRDVDALGHVNNAVYFTYMEHARIAYLRRLGLFSGDPSDTGMIVAEAACAYKAPIVFGQSIVVRMRATNLKNSSFIFEYSLEDSGSGQVMATGRSVQVCYDYVAGRSTPIPTIWRERIEAFERGE